MIKKIGGFLEEHVEKIILIIVGLLCSWLLITRVLLTPNIVEHKGEKYGPGNIDEKIRQILKEKENDKDFSHIDIQLPKERNYTELLKNPLGDINPVFPGGPGLPTDINESDHEEPDIAMIKVTEQDVEHIRSVVFEPVIEVTGDRPYDESNSEPNDLDFVTVSGYLDISEIVDEFERCYPDPCMAKPIFASVNLQRQRKNADGQWSSWKNVPRTKIDYNRNLFKVVETFSDLPLGGLKIYKYQLNNIITQLELLQPEPYHIASAGEEWLPPTLHRELINAQKKDEREARRQESSEQNTTASTTGGRSRGRGGTTSRTGGISSALAAGTANRGGGSRRGGNTSRGGNRSRGGNTDIRTNPRLTDDPLGQDESYVNKVYDDFESIILTDDTDLTKISEQILFWAHDDTVEPDNTYRYRIRVGLLNPRAEEEGDKIIFWTDFSDETDEVNIRGKMFFFAMGDVQETAKTASVSVYKLALGYWYKKVFDRVAQGEMIGDIVENERKDTSDDTGDTTSSEEPETIDFTTGAIMVDVVRASIRTGGDSSDPLPYYDMLYSYDGTDIRHMPVTKTANSKIWPPDLYDNYVFVRSQINKKREPFQSWGASEIDISQVRGGMQSRLGIGRLR